MSLYLHDSFSQIIPKAKLVEMDYIMNEKIDLYSKLVNIVNKTYAYYTAIIVNTNNIDLKFQKSFTGLYHS